MQLGDLTDHGPDSPGALRIMFDLIDSGRGMFVLGNHDHKLARALLSRPVRMEPWLAETIEALDSGLRARMLARLGNRLVDGELTIVASEHRGQLANRRAARERLAQLLRQALADDSGRVEAAFELHVGVLGTFGRRVQDEDVEEGTAGGTGAGL